MSSRPQAAVQGIRILIVDNNAVEALDIEECLTEAGYVASSAHNGASALREAESAPPDLLLIDTHLKGSLPTCEVVETLQQQYDCSVVLLTTCWGDNLLAGTGRVAASACVTKPFAERALLDAAALAARLPTAPPHDASETAFQGSQKRRRLAGLAQRFVRVLPRVRVLSSAGLSERLWLSILGIIALLTLTGAGWTAACAAEDPSTRLPPLASEASKSASLGETIRGSFAPVVERVTPSVASIAAESIVGRNTEGVVMTQVDPNSAAARAGLRAGDILDEVEKRRVESLAGSRRVVQSVGKGPRLPLVNRNGNRSFVVVEPE